MHRTGNSVYNFVSLVVLVIIRYHEGKSTNSHVGEVNNCLWRFKKPYLIKTKFLFGTISMIKCKTCIQL